MHLLVAAIAGIMTLSMQYGDSSESSDNTDRMPKETEYPMLPHGLVIGIHGAGFFPVGSWSKHVAAGQGSGDGGYPADLDMFGPGLGGVFELGWKFDKNFSLTAQFDITTLSTYEWEKFAENHGSHISATAYQLSVTGLMGIELWRSEPFRLDLRLGIGYMQAFGEEENHDYDLSYRYNFLQPSFAIRTGLGASVTVSPGLDLTTVLDNTFGVPGVDYWDHENPYWSLTLSLGIRIWPGIIWRVQP